MLEAINAALSALGEARVTSATTVHPTVDIITTTLAVKRREFLERGWWFNTADVKMYPDSLGRLPYPNNALTVLGFRGETFIPRDGYLFDMDNNTNVFTEAKEIRVTYDVDFEDLPECVANVVSLRTTQEVYAGDLGVDSALQRLALLEQQALGNCEVLNMRNRRYNSRERRGFRRIVRALRN
jgi:hypothetical protein